MIIKLISLVLVLCSVELFIVGLQSPSDPLFLIVSNNPFFVSLRMLLLLAAVTLAFKSRFRYKISRDAAALAGTFLMIVGASGMMSQTITSQLNGFINYLDFWSLFLIGVVYNLSALSYGFSQRHLLAQKTLTRHLPQVWLSKLSSFSDSGLRTAKKS